MATKATTTPAEPISLTGDFVLHRLLSYDATLSRLIDLGERGRLARMTVLEFFARNEIPGGDAEMSQAIAARQRIVELLKVPTMFSEKTPSVLKELLHAFTPYFVAELFDNLAIPGTVEPGQREREKLDAYREQVTMLQDQRDRKAMEKREAKAMKNGDMKTAKAVNDEWDAALGYRR
jgi:hypothetical protein